jgi:hypothetical protein
VFTSFVQPRGFLYQLNETDYQNYFGREYRSVKLYTDDELFEIYKDYGEIDAFSNIRLLHESENVCNISINLLHNSFARRTWLKPGSDLYKGNGRVKHESHNIQQGPFQTVMVQSYQSNDKHDSNTERDYEFGGNNHFDIHVFRNNGMTGDSRPLETIPMSDLATPSGYSSERLAAEQTKEDVVKEFLEFIQGSISKQSLKSNIDDHEIPVKIMSSIYTSHILQQRGGNPIVKFDLTNQEAKV